MKNQNLVLAYFLPQFHEVPDNNLWWGSGFTEWTCIDKWKPYYKGHSIRLPNDFLGRYCLLDDNVLLKHAALAKKYGVDGFIVWDYWFGRGKQLLERPIKIVLEKGIDFPFCFAWANHSWFNKSENKLLQMQWYDGEEDYVKYFERCLDYFKLKNYIKINNCPLFFIFDPKGLKSIKEFKDVFTREAIKNGFPGIYFIGDNLNINDKEIDLFDGYLSVNEIMSARKKYSPIMYAKEQIIKRFRLNNLGPLRYKYKCLVKKSEEVFNSDGKNIPVVLSGWDTTPRHARRGTIYEGFCPESFEFTMNCAIKSRINSDNKIIVIKSWNEWAEGNVLEPDNVNGFSLLESIKRSRNLLNW